MRPTREITAEEENFRIEKWAGNPNMNVIKRDPVEPEPVGTVVLMAFRVIGYHPDYDGSLMAKLENIDKDGKPTGWEPNGMSLRPPSTLVVSPEELNRLFKNQ